MILGTLILPDWLIKLREGVLCYLGEERGLVLLASISAIRRRRNLPVRVLCLPPVTVSGGSICSHIRQYA